MSSHWVGVLGTAAVGVLCGAVMAAWAKRHARRSFERVWGDFARQVTRPGPPDQSTASEVPELAPHNPQPAGDTPR